MTRAQVIAAIAAQITSATAEGAITPTILGNIMNEAAELLNDVIPSGEIAVGTGTGIGSGADFFKTAQAVTFKGLDKTIQVLSPDENGTAYLSIDGSGNGYMAITDSAGNVTFRVMADGSVGIGTQGPTTKLHVVGTVRFVTGNEGTNKVLTSDADGNADWAVQPLRYVALLNQTGTDAPVATVLQNTTGATFSFGYGGVGLYTINADSGSPFTDNKTAVIFSLGTTNDTRYCNYEIISNSSITLRTIRETIGLEDGVMVNATLIIEIYP